MPEVIPADVAVKVLIAKSSAHVANQDAPFVAIFPDYDGWNDYGRNFFATLHIRHAAGDPIELNMRLMFQGRLRSAGAFDDLLAQYGDVFPIESVTTPFVSLLIEIEDYKKLIETLGFEPGVSALRLMHDATLARIEGTDQQAIDLSYDEDFHFGALRNEGAYDAIRRGGRYFRPNPPQPVLDAATNLVFSAKLQRASNPYTMRFRFNRDGLFRGRTSVLIGRNGVGKTQLLKSIVDALYEKHPDGRRRSRFLPAYKPSRVLVFSSVPTDPFPRSIGAWRGIDYEYFAVNASTDGGADPLLAALVACKKSEDRQAFGENRDKSRLEVVKDALKPIGLWDRLYIPLRPRRDDDELPGVINVDGLSYYHIGRGANEQNGIRAIQQIDWSRSAVVLDAAHNPRSLSSGEYAMLRFAAQASAAIEQGSLLLLDEPETHLHPNYVSDLMEILDNLLQSTKSVAIIATHSAYVVRETPRDRVNVLTVDEEGVVNIDTPRLQTFGATIDSISQFVFGDTNISHRYQKTLAEWADRVGRRLGIDGVIEAYGSELNSESLSFIARRLAEPEPDQPAQPPLD